MSARELEISVGKPFQYPCPNCGKPLAAQADDAGLQMECQSCGQLSVVPRNEAAERRREEEPPPQWERDKEPPPARRRSRPRYDEPENEPPSRLRKPQFNEAHLWKVLDPLMLAATAASIGSIILVIAFPLIGLICAPFVVMIAAACLTLSLIALAKGYVSVMNLVVLVFSGLVMLGVVYAASKEIKERRKHERESSLAGVVAERFLPGFDSLDFRGVSDG
jgi:DNA-directed RNA polymerase subunit RPC12/RpoP